MEEGREIPKGTGWDLVVKATKTALSEEKDYIIFNGSYKILDIETFEEYIKPIDLIINLELDENTMKTKMQLRAKIKGGIEDQRAEMYGTIDDERIEKRINTYQEKMDLILKEIKEGNYNYIEIDATQSEDEVFKQVCTEIEKLGGRKGRRNYDDMDKILTSKLDLIISILKPEDNENSDKKMKPKIDIDPEKERELDKKTYYQQLFNLYDYGHF